MVYQTYDGNIDVPHNVRLVNSSVFQVNTHAFPYTRNILIKRCQNPSPEIKNDLNNILNIWNNEIDVSVDIHKGEFKLPTKKKQRTAAYRKIRPQVLKDSIVL